MYFIAANIRCDFKYAVFGRNLKFRFDILFFELNMYI